ncbi:MAG: hypothetical protein FD166_491 [Bacteroidetes bacterium]|nr:MAG: hypothetical protein FD166_491 [Bacteroidota bacterium]
MLIHQANLWDFIDSLRPGEYLPASVRLIKLPTGYNLLFQDPSTTS